MNSLECSRGLDKIVEFILFLMMHKASTRTGNHFVNRYQIRGRRGKERHTSMD